MTDAPASWKERIPPRLREFLKQQQLFVFMGAVIYTFLSVMKTGAPFVLIMAMILCMGNAVGPLVAACQPLYDRRPSPWNWVLYMPVLLAVSLVNTAASAEIVRWMRPAQPAFWAVFRGVAPLIMTVTMTVGIISYAFRQRQRKLQEKNVELEQAVERGSVQLQQQEQELSRASEIQQGLLPKTLPQLPGVQIAGAWQPARTVSGDYFDVIQLDEHRLGICIGDVAGKGITAALLMANLQAAFRVFATPEAAPASVCSKLNTFLCGNVAPGKFITFFYAVLDANERTLSYENAGHSPGLLLRSSGQVEVLKGDGAVLGLLPEWSYKGSVVRLDAGDRLLLFTDGVTEAANRQEEEFGEERLIQAARRNRRPPAAQDHGAGHAVLRLELP
jgi:sigma-B regulation protein RsbU (phosphoserine phosphatase)